MFGASTKPTTVATSARRRHHRRADSRAGTVLQVTHQRLRVVAEQDGADPLGLSATRIAPTSSPRQRSGYRWRCRRACTAWGSCPAPRWSAHRTTGRVEAGVIDSVGHAPAGAFLPKPAGAMGCAVRFWRQSGARLELAMKMGGAHPTRSRERLQRRQFFGGFNQATGFDNEGRMHFAARDATSGPHR